MKKTLCCFICLLVVVTTITVAGVQNNTKTKMYDKITIEQDMEADNEAVVGEVCDETFEQIVEVLNETVHENGKYNNILVNFLYLTEGYKLPKTDTEYIARLIIDGYNAEDVIDATYFWLDTNEDIGIVEKLCEWKKVNEDFAENDFWTEHAFNDLTDGKYGSLTEGDISEYMKDGITAEDILTANKLSRKGIFTIQEILKMHQEGEKFAEIAMKTDNANLTNGDAEETKARTAENVDYIDDAEVLVGIELAAITNNAEAAYFDLTDDDETVAEKLEAETDEIFGRITKTLKQKGYLREKETTDED